MGKWETPRGFTLLELVITLSIVSILVAMAIPSFQAIKERSKVERLATELTGFFMVARSESVLRNTKLYAHITFPANAEYNKSDWTLTLTDSGISSAGTTIQVLSGHSYSGITVHHNYSSNRVSFEEVRGRAKSGTFRFFPTSTSTKQIELRTSNPPGRVKVCATSEAMYGYEKC